MKNRKFFTLSLAIAGLIGISAAIFSTHASDVLPAYAIGDAAPSFTGESELTDDDSLSVVITSSTTTDYGASYNIKFSTGAEALVDTNQMVDVTDDSGDLVAANTTIKEMESDEKKKLEEEIQQGIKQTEIIDGCFIYAIENKVDVIIPRTLSRGNPNKLPFFTGKINAIASGALHNNNRTENIYIPREITEIPSDAFEGPAAVVSHFYVEYSESEIPQGWAADWNHGVAVTYNYNIYDGSRAIYEDAKTTSTVTVGDATVNYIIGYFPTQGTKYPLIVEYKLEGDNAIRFKELPKVTVNQNYDGVGKLIHGFINVLSVDIDLNAGEKIVMESIVVHNIFKANRVEIEGRSEYQPDFDSRYFTKPYKQFVPTYDLSSFLNISFARATSFGGYTSIAAHVKQADAVAIYRTLKPGQYEAYRTQIESGRAYIRYRFTALTSSNYRVTYADKDVYSDVDTPVAQFIIKNANSELSFVFKDSEIGSDYNINKLKAFAINNAVITMDVVVGTTIVNRTAVSTRFGSIYFMSPHEQNVVFNGDLFITLIAVGYSVFAIVLGVILFFAYKKKYRNDEFRRLKPKQFIKKGIIYWLTSLELVLTLTFIIFRSTVFANAIVVYNPVDIFIVLFAVAAIIIIGYYVKVIVTTVKANNKRKKDLKLGIANDVVDDGTK